MKVVKNTCKISIFIPVYNGSKYLEQTINSILNQTFRDFNLLCVDDSSTDNSFVILNKLAKKDSRIKVYQKENGGIVPISWNYILPFIDSEFIMYMSQDDLMSNNLELLMKKQLETNADCVLPDMIFYNEEKKDNKTLVGYKGDRFVVLTNREAVELSLNWQIHGFALWNSKLFRNEYFD